MEHRRYDQTIIKLAQDLRTLPNSPKPPFFVVVEGISTKEMISFQDTQFLSATKLNGEYVKDKLLTMMSGECMITPMVVGGKNDFGMKQSAILVTTDKHVIDKLIDQLIHAPRVPLEVQQNLGILSVVTYEDLIYVLMLAHHFYHTQRHSFPVMTINFYYVRNQQLFVHPVYFDNPTSKHRKSHNHKSKPYASAG